MPAQEISKSRTIAGRPLQLPAVERLLRRVSGTEAVMRAIHRILCPVDVSDVSRHAIAHAAVLAGWYKAKITALHVCNPIVIPATDFSLIGNYIPPMLTDEDMAAVREQMARLFCQAGDVDVEVMVQSGPIAKQIVDCAQALPADLIVIGTHGVGGFEHLLLGSVTERVLRQATCPVLTVPPRSRTTSRLPFKRILCPVDFSAPSLAALDFATSLARDGDADLIVLHVFEWPDEPLATRPMLPPEYREAMEREVTAKLDAEISASARQLKRLTTRIGHGKAYREILGVVAEDSCDLVVMGVHGRNALDVMLFGSTTNQVVRRATCPVLTLRK